MTHLRVKPINFDKNDETLYKSKEVTLEGKKFSTPIISLDTRLITRNDQLATATKGLNEIYRTLETKNNSLKRIVFDRRRQDEFNSRIETERNKTNPTEEMTVCILEYAGESYPLGRQLEFILDTAYCFSDIVPLPPLPKITKAIRTKSKFEQYVIFLEEIISFLRSFNEKPIMGIVPRLAYGHVANLMEFYIAQGIIAFLVDFEAHNPTTFKQNLLPIFRTLKKHEMIDNCFLYAHNVDAGRFVKAKDIVNAKDVLSFGFGFDTMGRRHKPLRMPEKEWKKLNTLPNKIRLFNKNDYGYYKILNTQKISEMYPDDSCVSISAFRRGFAGSIKTLRRFEKLFNAEQLGLEAFRLRQIVKEDIPTEYLATKTHVKKQHIKIIRNFRDDIYKQKSLLGIGELSLS